MTAIDRAAADLRYVGYSIIEGVLDDPLLEEIRAAMYRARDRIHDDVGAGRIERAGELGVLRLLMRYEPVFMRLLEIPEMLEIVDRTVSETAILHLQNGFILPSSEQGAVPTTFQTTFHRDFPRHIEGYVASINVMFAIDEYSAENGGTLVVPGTHQRSERPDEAYMEARAIPVVCGPGSMIAFDSTLWHAAGPNASGRDRLGINHQFTRSFIKQQIDYVRALGDLVVEAQPPRTQQLLGWYTRVVTSLDEYYRPAEERLYRSGQG